MLGFMDAEMTHDSVWSVWRQDDNGNLFLVQDGLTESEALSLVQEFEKEDRKHKQTYWAKETME